MQNPPDDICITKRKTAPYWWPETQSLMQLFLSISAVGLVWYVVQRLLAEGGLKIDPSVRDLVVFILGIIFGCFKDVYGYTFGSSAGQKRQGEVITKSLEDKDRIIADNVATNAATATAATAAIAAVTPSADALKAAAVVAPAAAAAAAPPAAEVAAPPAAEKAVADALAAQQHPESETTKPKQE